MCRGNFSYSWSLLNICFWPANTSSYKGHYWHSTMTSLLSGLIAIPPPCRLWLHIAIYWRGTDCNFPAMFSLPCPRPFDLNTIAVAGIDIENPNLIAEMNVLWHNKIYSIFSICRSTFLVYSYDNLNSKSVEIPVISWCKDINEGFSWNRVLWKMECHL